MLSPVRLSSVSSLQRLCVQYTLLTRFKFSGMFLGHFVPWPPVDIHEKFHGDRPRETPPVGGLNARGVVKYCDFGPIEGYISETVHDMRYVSINH